MTVNIKNEKYTDQIRLTSIVKVEINGNIKTCMVVKEAMYDIYKLLDLETGYLYGYYDDNDVVEFVTNEIDIIIK